MATKRTGKEPGAKGQPFWQTVPGLITALAALLTAIGGCVALFTTNPRLLDLVLKPSATATTVVAQSTAGNVPGASTSMTSVAPAASLSSRPVQMPDGQRVTFLAIGHTYQYTILSATLDPLPPDQMLLALKIRVYSDNGLNFWSSSFRLSVGDQLLAPSNFLDVVVGANETSDGDAQFQVDPSVKEATLKIILPLDVPDNTKELRLLFP